MFDNDTGKFHVILVVVVVMQVHLFFIYDALFKSYGMSVWNLWIVINLCTFSTERKCFSH